MKIAILDDNVILTKSIKKFFVKEGHTVDTFHTKADFLKSELISYDIFILDIDLPDGNGLKITKYLRTQQKIDSPILIISAHEELDTKLEWFTNGIDDYIVKPFSPLEIEARIQAIMRKAEGVKKAKRNLEYKDVTFDRNMRRVILKDEEIDFSKKEKSILEFFMVHQDTFISKHHLAESIWWPVFDRPKMNNSISVAICKIRKKLWKNFKLSTINGEWYILENATQLDKKISLKNIMPH